MDLAVGTESDSDKCGKCRHFRHDPEAGRQYFGEPNRHSGWCLIDPDSPYATLSGDWCADFEAKP